MKIAIILFVLGAAISIGSCLKCYESNTGEYVLVEASRSARKWKAQGEVGRVDTTVCRMSTTRGRRNNIVESFVSIGLRGSREMACYRSHRQAGATRTTPFESCICATDGCNREMPANIEPFMSPMVNCTSVSGGSYQCGGTEVELGRWGDKCGTYVAVRPQSFYRDDWCIKSLGDTGCIVDEVNNGYSIKCTNNH